ncbi:MAG: DUF6455 family protein [Pseudomonadota bacterium]
MSEKSPKPLAPERQAYWRVVAMAEATHTDLAAAFEAGDLTTEAWGKTVEACRGCPWAKGCDAWLEAGNGAQRDVPAACENAEMFERLQTG